MQEKLRSEVSAVLAENAEPDFRTLKSMEYLDQVMYACEVQVSGSSV